jgi:simple sugar transport system ATP-binding protein
MAERAPLIELRNVSKSFAGIQALKDVSISVRAGLVLCLLGDNGAGKSTLIKILSGFHAPSSGELYVDGARTHLRSPREARSLGIATVHQEVGTIPLMSIARNFFLGAEPTEGWGPFRRFDIAKANAIALEQIRGFGLTRVASGDQLVGTLSGGERQVVAIARAMYFGARVLILDEPTSALGVKEAAKVLTLMKAARERGIGIVFITHNARHAMLIGDHFVVLNQGTTSAVFNRGDKSREEVLNLMAGGDLSGQADADLAFFEDIESSDSKRTQADQT